MTSRRVLKAAAAIREVVSMTILTELRDPRISDVTVTFVEVAGDMQNAKVHVSVMGDEAKQKRAVSGLQSASGFLQQKIARRINTRYTPKLRFVLDQGVKQSLEVSRILEEVLPEDGPSDDPAVADPAVADPAADDDTINDGTVDDSAVADPAMDDSPIEAPVLDDQPPDESAPDDRPAAGTGEPPSDSM